MATHSAVLEALLEVLLKEEALLRRLLEQAQRERQVLIDSDFAGLAEVTEGMLHTAAELESQERVREDLLRAIDGEQATLGDIAGEAEAIGIQGFGQLRARLIQRAEELRAAQEQNAALLLSAASLRERWFRLLTGMAGPTYDARGEQRGPGQRLVSRSA